MSLRRAVVVSWLIIILTGGCAPQAAQTPGGPSVPAPGPTPRTLPETASLIVNSTEPANGPDSPEPSKSITSPTTAIPTRSLKEVAAPTVTATGGPAPTPPPTVTPTARPTASAGPASPIITTPAGVTPDGIQRRVRVPILMYHYVSVPPPRADVYRKDLSVSPERFDSHLAYLRDAGYHVITLDDLMQALTEGRVLPEKPVILTFDDGYADNYTNAFPLLQKYGFVAQFFLITDFVNQGRAGYMNWQEIEEMGAAGQRFGSHSRDHPDLRGKPTAYLVWQALGGLEAIQEHLGYHPRWIAYPSGAYDANTIAVYKSANYWGGVTTQQGATHKTSDLFELSRVRVRGSYTAQDLERVLNANW